MAKIAADLALKISASTAELKKGLETANQNINSFKNQTQNSLKDIHSAIEGIASKFTMAFAGIGAAVGTVVGVVKSFKEIIESNMEVADAWKAQTEGIGNAWNYVKNAISRLDFTDLITNINNAYEAGLKYAEVLDLLEHRERSYDIAVANSAEDLARLKHTYLTSKDSDVKKDALIESEKILTDLALQNQKNKKFALEESIKKVTDTQHIAERTLLDFIEFQGTYEQKFKLAEEYLKKFNELSKTERGTTSQGTFGPTTTYESGYEEKTKRLKEELKAYPAEIANIAEFLPKINEKIIKLITGNLIAFKNANAAVIEDSNVLEKKWAILDRKEDAAVIKQEKQIEIQKGSITDLTKKYDDLQKLMNATTDKDLLQKYIQESADLTNKIQDANNKLQYLKDLVSGTFAAKIIDTPSTEEKKEGITKMGKTAKGISPEIDLEGLKKAEKQEKIVAKTNLELANAVDIASESYKNLGSNIASIGDALHNTTGSWIKFIGNVLSAIPILISNFKALINIQRTQAISGAVSSASDTPFPFNLIAIGISIAATLAGLATSVPKMARGGLAYGNTLTQVGEYSGIRTNPEVIAPLDKLKSILNIQNQGNMQEVRFRIDGYELVGILNKQSKKIKVL